MVAALSQAPRSPAESLVSITSAGTNRLRSRTSNLVWQSVFCSICNCEYGHYKYDPSPGSRDSPTWDYRVADEQGLDFCFDGFGRFVCFFAHSCFARCMACERELPKKNTYSENHRRWSQIMASGKQTEMSLQMKKMVGWLTAEISFLRWIVCI